MTVLIHQGAVHGEQVNFDGFNFPQHENIVVNDDEEIQQEVSYEIHEETDAVLDVHADVLVHGEKVQFPGLVFFFPNMMTLDNLMKILIRSLENLLLFLKYMKMVKMNLQ